METAAGNEGGSGQMMGAGMGLGMGVGIGGAFGTQVGNIAGVMTSQPAVFCRNSASTTYACNVSCSGQ